MERKPCIFRPRDFDVTIHRLWGRSWRGLREMGLLVLNSYASPPIFCSDMGHISWMGVGAASPAVIPGVVEWFLCNRMLQNFSDHRLIVSQMFHHPTKTTFLTTLDWTLVNWRTFSQHFLLSLNFPLLDHKLLELRDLYGAIDRSPTSFSRSPQMWFLAKELACSLWRDWH